MKMNNYPLFLPEGSVRAILALSMIMFTFWYFYLFRDIPKELVSMLTFTITYYFTKRDGYEKKSSHYKLRYRENNQSDEKETIISGITPGECIEKLRENLSENEYLNLMVDKIERID